MRSPRTMLRALAAVAALAGSLAVAQDAPLRPTVVSVISAGTASLLISTATGATLYVNATDPPGVSTCASKPVKKHGPICTQTWPPLEAVPGDGTIGDYTVIKRDDGMLQWAYRGQPLYLYAKDQIPLEAHGDGVDGVWHIARP